MSVNFRNVKMHLEGKNCVGFGKVVLGPYQGPNIAISLDPTSFLLISLFDVFLFINLLHLSKTVHTH